MRKGVSPIIHVFCKKAPWIPCLRLAESAAKWKHCSLKKRYLFEGCERLFRRDGRRKAPKEESLKTICHKGHIEHRGSGSLFQIHILLWIL